MVGDRNKEENIIRVELYQMNPDALGLTDTDVLEQDTARSAIDEINSAIDQISSVRSYYGAVQNRLEHTVSSLGCTVENLTASESRIRDMDMAKAMMEYVRNSILVQSSQAMLAQANQSIQGVLSLPVYLKSVFKMSLYVTSVIFPAEPAISRHPFVKPFFANKYSWTCW